MMPNHPEIALLKQALRKVADYCFFKEHSPAVVKVFKKVLTASVRINETAQPR